MKPEPVIEDLVKPDLRFKEFALILKCHPNPLATSYDAVWKFEDLLA